LLQRRQNALAAEEKTGTRLALAYESIRREEHEVITDLLDVLPRVGGIDENRVAQVRDALFHADNPYLMVFVGPFSSGKSSLINALLGSPDLLRVGPTPTTDRITILRWGEDAERMTSGGDTDTVFHPSPLLKKVSFVDTPGMASTFREHEATTTRFLHRSDTVFMVMPATQALSAKNLETLQTLKQYGKNIIILVNQADLLSEEERTDLQSYVQDQSQSKLGYKPEVWLVSAHQALEAYRGEERDAALWEASGLAQLEAYIDGQLGDVARLRQKLQTPLQITQNVTQTALETVRENQAVFDKYTGIAENVRSQLETHRRTQQRNIRDEREEIEARFNEASERGRAAIRDQFRFSRALGAVVRGTLELLRLGNLVKPAGSSTMRTAFETHRAFEPILALPGHVDALAAQVEGHDIRDLDNLVDYAMAQYSALPPGLQAKMIGKLSTPQSYNRSALVNVRDDLDPIEDEARKVETDNLDEVLRNTVIYLAIYEIILLLFGLVVVGVLVSQPDATIAGLLVLVLVAMVAGLGFVPLRGRMLENVYASRIAQLQSRYLERLSKAANDQLHYSMKLREDAVAPLLGLIESQTEMQREQLDKLQAIQQRTVKIEAALADMGKPRLLAGLENLTR
jgi:GTP-binding protein EngB required for normal cell division